MSDSSVVRHKEVQQPYLWVWLLLAVICGFPAWLILQGEPWWPTIAPAALSLVIILFFLPLTVEVQRTRLRVVFGVVPLFVWNYPFEQLERVESVTYTPLKTYLGWGMRRGLDGSKALTIRGTRGVMLHQKGGRRVLIGSQKPEELARALDEARGNSA